jgi:hypothetical protein
MKQILFTWGVAMVLFLAVAVLCVGFIFSPVKDGNKDNYVALPASSLVGLKLQGESWRRYPNYVIGLGAAAAISFGGAIFCIYNITKAKEAE